MSYPPYQTPIAGKETVTREWLLYFRNLVAGGGGGAAPSSATYVVAAPTGTLPNSRVATSTATVAVNTGTAGLIKWDLANTAVTPGTYGDATHVGQFTVDQQGRLTAASNVAITGVLLLRHQVTLTNTDIINLPSTVFEILPAQGLNTQVNVFNIFLSLNASAGGYGAIDPAAFLYVQFATGRQYGSFLANDATLVPPRAYLNGMFTSAERVTACLQQFVDTVETSQWGNLALPIGLAEGGNSALQLIWNNNGGAATLSGGNAANSMVVTTYYTVEAV